MQMDVPTYVEFQHIRKELAEIMRVLANLVTQQGAIMATLTDVQTDVTAEDTVVDSAVVLLQGLAAQIAALTPNQAAIDALAADVTAKTQVLANAVAANTPAGPTGATGPTGP